MHFETWRPFVDSAESAGHHPGASGATSSSSFDFCACLLFNARARGWKEVVCGAPFAFLALLRGPLGKEDLSPWCTLTRRPLARDRLERSSRAGWSVDGRRTQLRERLTSFNRWTDIRRRSSRYCRRHGSPIFCGRRAASWMRQLCAQCVRAVRYFLGHAFQRRLRRLRLTFLSSPRSG